jgi:hypothetical protein
MPVSGIETGRENYEDALYEAGCDDALIAVVNGTMFLDFTETDCRSKTPSNRHRVMSNLREVRSLNHHPPQGATQPS